MLKILALVLALTTLEANATDRAGQFSVGGTAGLATKAPWADTTFRNTVGWGPKVGLHVRKHLEDGSSGLEFSMDYFTLSKQKLKSRSFMLTYFWRFSPERRLHPVIGAGVGLTKPRNFYTPNTKDQPIFRLRAGLEWEWKKNIDLMFHLDQLTIFKENPRDPNAHVLIPSVGFSYYFGAPMAAAPAAAAPAAAAATASTNASNADSDGDGVIDAKDMCKGTEKGVSVNDIGCAEKQSFEVRLNVKFRSGTASLMAGSEKELETLADLLKTHSDLKVELQGHTDSSGSEAKNLSLSQARADAVKKVLVTKYSVDANRLVAKGYGESQPVDTNNNAGGRQNNRRVTAVIVR